MATEAERRKRYQELADRGATIRVFGRAHQDVIDVLTEVADREGRTFSNQVNVVLEAWARRQPEWAREG